jgi:hypothetical protein
VHEYAPLERPPRRLILRIASGIVKSTDAPVGVAAMAATLAASMLVGPLTRRDFTLAAKNALPMDKPPTPMATAPASAISCRHGMQDSECTHHVQAEQQQHSRDWRASRCDHDRPRCRCAAHQRLKLRWLELRDAKEREAAEEKRERRQVADEANASWTHAARTSAQVINDTTGGNAPRSRTQRVHLSTEGCLLRAPRQVLDPERWTRRYRVGRTVHTPV